MTNQSDTSAAFSDLPDLPGMPTPEDQLFSSHEDWWNNARLNWSSSTWSLYAAGYREAADCLVERIESRPAGQDTLVYPILFLYRQYLELQLKLLIRTLRHLLDERQDFPAGHRLDQLWQEAESLIRKAFPDQSRVELNETGRLVKEFAAVDPLSTAFRYPVDRDGNPSLPGLVHINLRNVRQVIGKVSSLLEGAYALADEHLEHKLEMEREFRSDSYY